MNHAPLAPSSADQWVKCWGAPKMQSLFPERPDSPSAMEGTAAHWVVSELMHGRVHPAGSLAPNGICITEEMQDGAELFADQVPGVLFGTDALHIEETVMCPEIHADCWGTPDLWYLWQGVIYVKDYKYGHGYIDAWRNWQLLCYASGIRSSRPEWVNLDIDLGIVQPRCFTGDGAARSWLTTPDDMRPLIDMLKVAATAAMDESRNDICNAWVHCRYCSAIVNCPAAQQAASYAIRVSGESLPAIMPLPALGLMRQIIADAQDMLKAMAGGMDEELEAAIRAGKDVPGWTMAAGRGKVAWSVPVDEVVSLGQMIGVELDTRAVITPTQAGALFKKAGLDATLLSDYTVSMPGALKLVKSDIANMSRIFK